MKNRAHREEFEDWFLNTMPADRKSWLFGAWLAGAKFEREEMHNLIDAELEGLECSNGLRDHVSDTVRDRGIAVEASLATNVFEAQAVVNKLKAAATKEVERLTTHNALGQGSADCGASPAPTGCASNGSTEKEE